ncbi:MAG: hypothetical protein OXM01_08845 [Gemmatimonadota bacterium]|nr:hypothetical protein [Gemmatimonadota bacterium]
MNVPAAIAAMVIAAQSGNRDPLDDAYRDATPVFDVPALRAVDAVSPDGLYPQGQLPCEFLLYCDGSVGCFPCPEDETAPPAALTDWAHWHYALTVLEVRPPWTREEFEDLHEWLSALIEETELGCADDAT